MKPPPLKRKRRGVFARYLVGKSILGWNGGCLLLGNSRRFGRTGPWLEWGVLNCCRKRKGMFRITQKARLTFSFIDVTTTYSETRLNKRSLLSNLQEDSGLKISTFAKPGKTSLHNLSNIPTTSSQQTLQLPYKHSPPPSSTPVTPPKLHPWSVYQAHSSCHSSVTTCILPECHASVCIGVIQ